MKRFTETRKWEDPWFRKLAPTVKLLWGWLTDNCDNAGVISLDMELASFHIGQTIQPEHLDALGDRVQTLPNGKLWIPKFVPFQFGTLRASSNLHKSVCKVIASHNLPQLIPPPRDGQPLDNPPPTHDHGLDGVCPTHDHGLGMPQGKGKGKGKGKGEGGAGGNGKFVKPTLDEVKVAMKDAGLPEAEAQRFLDHYESNGWKVGKSKMQSWPHAIGTWKHNYNERHPAVLTPGALSGVDKVIHSREKEQVEAKIQVIRNRYDSHQDMSEKDRAEMATLKARLAELRKLLNVLL